MRKSVILFFALAVLLCVSGSLNRANAAPAKAGDCDRACLNDMADKFLAAVVAHDPSKLPHSANVKYTENNVQLQLGDGLWATATGIGAYKIYMDDPEAGISRLLRRRG